MDSSHAHSALWFMISFSENKTGEWNFICGAQVEKLCLQISRATFLSRKIILVTQDNPHLLKI